jgi:hypothetical protein
MNICSVLPISTNAAGMRPGGWLGKARCLLHAWVMMKIGNCVFNSAISCSILVVAIGSSAEQG